jgi:hypothetical protein
MPSFVLLMPGFSTRANRDSIAQTTTSTWNSSSSRATLREENVEKDLGPEEWQPTNGASRFGADERHFGKKILLVFHFSPDLAFALSDLVDSARLVPSSTLASPATCKSFELWNRRENSKRRGQRGSNQDYSLETGSILMQTRTTTTNRNKFPA